MLLTDQQIHAIRQIIQDYHHAFIINALSPDAVSAEILEKLKEKGLINVQVNSIQEAYIYGQLLAALENKNITKMGYTEFKNYLRKNPVPLTDIEKRAASMAALNAAQYVTGLGNRVNLATGDVLLEADAKLRSKLETTIKTSVQENIERRQSIKQLKSNLGWLTKDWSRDFDRIAVTEKQFAMLRGQADSYRKQHEDPLVFKRPMPDACKRCNDLYLDENNHPKIFRLSVLEANGTNVGRKQADWLPTVGPIHPNCKCVMGRVPEGYGFDENDDLVPNGEYNKVYNNEADLKASLLFESDLRKSGKLQGSLNFQGLNIAVENKKGSTRYWATQEGEKGQTKMLVHYGYIKRTDGVDGDALDVFVGPDKESDKVFIISQQNPETGLFDEYKIILGFKTEKQAIKCYWNHYDNPAKFYINVIPMDLDHLKRWINQPRKLVKARITPDMVGTTQFGNRAPSRYATGINVQMKIPLKKKTTGYTPDMEILKQRATSNMEPVRQDKEVYMLPRKKPSIKPIQINRDTIQDRKKISKQAEKRRAHLVHVYKTNNYGHKNSIYLLNRDKENKWYTLGEKVATIDISKLVVAKDNVLIDNMVHTVDILQDKAGNKYYKMDKK